MAIVDSGVEVVMEVVVEVGVEVGVVRKLTHPTISLLRPCCRMEGVEGSMDSLDTLG